MKYKSGIALASATRAAKQSNFIASRNPKGTPKEEFRCKYNHPKYCVVLGHRDARSKECYAHTLTKKDRDDVAAVIFGELVSEELTNATQKCKYYCTYAYSFLY